MKTARICAGMSVIVLFGMLLAGAADGLKEIPVTDVGTKVVLIGKLGKPMGTVMTMTGLVTRAGTLSPDSISVESLDGKRQDKLIETEFRSAVKLHTGDRVTLRGYENCGMSGTITDPEDKVPPENVQQPWKFESWFEVMKVK